MAEDGLHEDCVMQRKEAYELYVDGGALINNSHEALLDGVCSIVGAHDQEEVGFGQVGVCLCYGVCCEEVVYKHDRWTRKGGSTPEEF